MKPITLKEILPFQQYESVRLRLRPLFIAEKERRRLAVSDHLTLLFENGQTVWYQVEEMLRIEQITQEAAIRHEIDTYNELLPRPGELTATMLLEFTDTNRRDAWLRELVGLQRHFWLNLNGVRKLARFDERQIDPERVSSVQFVRFPLGGVDADEFLEFANAGKIVIEIDHPKMQSIAEIRGPLARALARDLID